MKKFIVIISLLFVALLNINAQENAHYDYDMGYNGTWLATPLTAGDSIGVSDSIWYYTVRKFTTNKVYPTVRVALDKKGGTPADVTVRLMRKEWVGTKWTTESTVTYAGTVDTAFTISGSTARVADYWRLDVRCATDEFNVVIDSLYVKLVY